MAVMDALPVSLRSCFDLTWQFLTENHPEVLDYFRAAGLFHTNMIEKAALEQAAGMSDPVVGDQYARLLKRYNLLDVVMVTPFKLDDEETCEDATNRRYIKLHTLVHAYAREKRPDTKRYWDAVTKMADAAQNNPREMMWFSNAIVFHWADILKAYWYWRETCGEEEADKKIGAMTKSVLLLMQNQILYGAGLAQIPITEVGPALHIWILNEYGASLLDDFKRKSLKSPVAEEAPTLQEARTLFQRAWQLGLTPADNLEVVKEKCRTVIGLVDCELQAGRSLKARELLQSASSEKIFSQCTDETILMNLDILRAEICIAYQEYREALGHIRAARRWECSFFARTDLYRLLAKCYRNLGLTWRAKLIYSGVFWKGLTDPLGHIDDGLTLADCLIERGEAVECLVVTHKLEELLEEFEKFKSFWIPCSRLWQYRAQAYDLLGNRKQKARAAERKSRKYLQRIEDLRKLLEGARKKRRSGNRK
jgi:tetratricopeptide (TPR) repeat protein